MKIQRLVVALLMMVVPLFSVFALTHGTAHAATSHTNGKTLTSKQFTAGPFTGKFTIHHFVMQGGHLMAQGTYTGTLKDKAGKEHAVNQGGNLKVQSTSGLASATTLQSARPMSVTDIVTRATTACTILHLVLGPINLNLLGLVVTTNQIVVDITAQPGPGNLLGNLLCGIVNLANGGLPTLNQILLGDIALLLNQLLTGLGL